jgi:hypothetical protein
MSDFITDQESANRFLKSADQVICLARYALNRQELTADGLDWENVPDIHAALVGIAKAEKMLDRAKTILLNS